jgi:hypothetical protein
MHITKQDLFVFYRYSYNISQSNGSWLINRLMFSISDQYFSFINDCKLVCKWWSRMGFMVLLCFYGFNNISAISWRSDLLVEETGWRGENHRPAESHWQTWSHNVVYLALALSSEIRTHNISGDRHRLHR